MSGQIAIPQEVLDQIHRHGEVTYPEEGAGFLLGHELNGQRTVTDLLMINNAREETARHNRYLLTPLDVMASEDEAAARGLDVVGIFHSHPDHPSRPSDYDREWALPWYSYVITSVESGKATGSRSWRLTENREGFYEEQIEILPAKVRN
jgi:proteasome lid subunit RPN8/RPN11